jgi:hypothetical protein
MNNIEMVADAGTGYQKGSLTIVGTGIKAVGQVTLESHSAIMHATRLLYLVADPVTEAWIRTLKPDAESLQRFYGEGKDRLITYNEMVSRILECVAEGGDVCVAFYGHPGIFVYPSHEAIRIARERGHRACMYSGISAEDCLFSDLGIDPASKGCRSYEATEFLMYSRQVDVTTALILWQIGAIGEFGYRTDRMFNAQGIEVLIDVLDRSYGGAHRVIVYEANQYPVCNPVICETQIRNLASARVTPISTLYVPPLCSPSLSKEMAERLGIRAPVAAN